MLNSLNSRLESVNPLAILQRGYALVYNAGGELVKSYSQTRPDESIDIRLAEGRLKAKVTGTAPPDQTGW